MTIWLPRVRLMLGADPSELDEAILQRAVANLVPEGADLDWKSSLYGNADRDKQELAKDVAAMANSEGGLIVLGIAEDAQGCASGLAPVALSDAEILRMRQIIASLTAPMVPAVDIRSIRSASDPDQGFVTIVVPRSAMAPHAVVANARPSYSYPTRNGTTTIWLSEWQVAQRYRDRFSLARGQVADLSTIMQEGRSNSYLGPESAWLCLALVPELVASKTLDRQFINDVRDFGQQWGNDRPIPELPFIGDPRPGRRRVRIFGDQCLLELRTNGAAFGGMLLGVSPTAGFPILADVTRLELVTILLLDLLAKYASWAGAGGDVIIAAEVKIIGTLRLTRPSAAGHTLVYGDFDSLGDAPPAELTAPLMALVDDPTELVGAAKALASDLLAECGVVETLILRDRTINVSAAEQGQRHQLRDWATRRGLDVT